MVGLDVTRKTTLTAKHVRRLEAGTSPVSRAAAQIARLRRELRIANVIGEYVKLRNLGSNLVGLCPFHHDHNPSLTVYPETGTFHCFGCQAHGDVLNFLMRIENLSFPEALKALREITPHYDPRD